MSDITRRAIIFAIALGTVVVIALICLAVLRPVVHASLGAVIVDTTISSSVIDHQGIAFSFVPAGLSCGISGFTPWCEVANWSLAA